MKLRKLSPKLERATEDYLIQMGSSRECLTDEQFRVVSKYVKIKRQRTCLVLFLLATAVFEALLIIWIITMAKSFVDSKVSRTVKEIALISSVDEKHVPTIVFRNDFMIIELAGWLCGMFTTKLIWILMEALMGLRVNIRRREEIIECFLPRSGIKQQMT